MSAVETKERQGSQKGRDKVAVTVVTPSGIYPADGDPLKIDDDKLVADALEKAGKKLKLTNTTDWVVFVGPRSIDPDRSFEANGLSGVVELQWHKREGGGGAFRTR